ncbi:hypothetical protein CONCODRAFT_73520 [Conidiobolus coronatus NRRL 28638]|uniref:C2H2-type domain-containing protein n=1 Tax=Conidiobolus coronatus (strain ATCC 28846 / CBS 209.66 / NRRL 28638) TaxID=796925 RepID=A0A137NVE5_CONC2|nr:hypothetical protein CONCODRAFT_73520 [Conidiobolus coronatus NRRL 28638]|eukprot:KXN66668.1 hypothetical protein CONCODRAFT_73520 [Conidiobolus coronatus NRRL 28638]
MESTSNNINSSSKLCQKRTWSDIALAPIIVPSEDSRIPLQIISPLDEFDTTPLSLKNQGNPFTEKEPQNIKPLNQVLNSLFGPDGMPPPDRRYSMPALPQSQLGRGTNPEDYSLSPFRRASLGGPIHSSSTSSYPSPYYPTWYTPRPTVTFNKRPRRSHHEVMRIFACNWPGCDKAYGMLNHLNSHIRNKSHGPRRLPEEFSIPKDFQQPGSSGNNNLTCGGGDNCDFSGTRRKTL